MKNATQVFYLAVFSLLSTAHVDARSNEVSDTCAVGCTRSPILSSNTKTAYQIDPKAIVSDACTSYAALDDLNAKLSPSLKDITQTTDFFSYYRLNLYNKACPFWSDDNGLCGNRACAVDTLENEEDIPFVWRAEELSKLEGPRAGHPDRSKQQQRPQKPLQGMLGENVGESCVVEYDDECDDRDYCVPEDEGAAGKGDYVSLVNNTERFTGYSGPGARQVWDAIYKENCFSKAAVPYKSFNGAKNAAKDLRHVFQEYGRQHVDGDDNDRYPLDDDCLEQRAFYRIISGMHASISTHLCWDYFNQTTGQWVRNLQCYQDRLHDYPSRVSNLYFNYALLTRAIVKLRKQLQSYTFCSGDPMQDQETKTKVLALADHAASAPSTFDESAMFHNVDGMVLKEDFRNRFRNVSRLMDCVGCDKCRLWGKLQTAGYGAALKVLFEFDENTNGHNPLLRRTELVALINTYDRVSHSLKAIKHFRSELGEVQADQKPVKGKLVEDTHPLTHDLDADFEEFDDDTRDHQFTLKEEFLAEFNLVYRAFVYVIGSWISFPFKL